MSTLKKGHVKRACREWLRLYAPDFEGVLRMDWRSLELGGEFLWGAAAADHYLLVTEGDGGLDVRSEHVVTGDAGPSCFWEVADEAG